VAFRSRMTSRLNAGSLQPYYAWLVWRFTGNACWSNGRSSRIVLSRRSINFGRTAPDLAWLEICHHQRFQTPQSLESSCQFEQVDSWLLFTSCKGSYLFCLLQTSRETRSFRLFYLWERKSGLTYWMVPYYYPWRSLETASWSFCLIGRGGCRSLRWA
jgi:hypothetical protein